MAVTYDPRAIARMRLDDEQGTLYVDAPSCVALVYPSPYTVAMSSLGYQTIYRKAHAVHGRAAHRAFLRTTSRPSAQRGSGCSRTR
jgi:hypothetical protein